MEDKGMTLTKADIINRVYKEVGFSKKEASELTELLFTIMKETLAKGDRIKVSGFGHFTVRDKRKRLGRNPQTGSAMEISARRVLTFKASQILREDITERYGHRIDSKGIEDMNTPPNVGGVRALGAFTGGEVFPENEDDDE